MAIREELDIVVIGRIDKGIVVHFTNGESVLYHGNFLYDVRNDDSNRPLSNGPEDDVADGL